MVTVKRTLYILLLVALLATVGTGFVGCTCGYGAAGPPPACYQWIESAKDKAYDEGRQAGIQEGKQTGYSEGYSKGLEEGRSQCPDCPECPECDTSGGYWAGYNAGLNACWSSCWYRCCHHCPCCGGPEPPMFRSE
jgi:hypothetical protein